MNTSLHDTATVRDLFFDGSPDRPAEALTHLLQQSSTIIRRVPLDLIDNVWRELADETNRFMSTDLTDIVAAGWAQCDAFESAARSTRDDPDATEVVALVPHRIAASQRPSIEVYLGGTRLAAIEIELEIAVTIAGMIAVVNNAQLTEVRAGNCTVSGALSVQGTVVMTRQHEFDLQGALRLRDGVTLDAVAPISGTEPVVVRMAEVRMTA
jgi:hypothetical protein